MKKFLLLKMNNLRKLIKKGMWINLGMYKKVIHFKQKKSNIGCG